MVGSVCLWKRCIKQTLMDSYLFSNEDGWLFIKQEKIKQAAAYLSSLGF